MWAAIATTDGVTAWMHPTTIEERAGGHYSYDMQFGDGWNESGAVAAYDPPRRFATAGVRWIPRGDAEPAVLATEWIAETKAGGSCSVRMVMSGFGPGDVWDDEIASMTAGMRQSLDALRLHLARATAKP